MNHRSWADFKAWSANAREYRRNSEISRQRNDLMTDLSQSVNFDSSYIQAVPRESAESLGMFFAAMSAAMLRHAHKLHHSEQEQESPQAEYLRRLASAPHEVADMLRRYDDLNRETAINEVARINQLSPGTVERALRHSATASRTLRRIEIERLLKAGTPINEIAKRLEIDRTTVWRCKKRLSSGQSWPRLGRPTSA